MQVVRNIFIFFLKSKSGDSYAVYALLALSKATMEALNSHPDKLLQIVINTVLKCQRYEHF